jgi:SAM-dependent methyltransferase
MFSKVCDAADWFDPALLRIIREELQEVPRFHRKQWEFAIILRVLESQGMLDGTHTGLSMGGGRERLLYAVARRVRRLVVTDLYAPEGSWVDARTADPDQFIRANKPFPVEDSKLQALRMDMRQLDFGDESFDFCYSSCALEHIGAREDFLRHLSEAYRVLRRGGIYVLTTEFHFGPEVIAHPGNFLFSAKYLEDLLADSPFTPEEVFDARLAPHKANHPLPTNVADLCFKEGESLSSALLGELSHIHLLWGKEPFGSAALVLRKDRVSTQRPAIRFRGLEETRAFMAEGVAAYRAQLERARLTLNPFAYLPGGSSPFCSRAVVTAPRASGDPTIFHTDYVWLGSGPRVFTLSWAVAERSGPDCAIELRIHAYRNLAQQETRCLLSRTLSLGAASESGIELLIDADEEDRYAVLGKLIGGPCVFEWIAVESARASSP